MPVTKITLIGAASVSFGVGTIRDLIAHAETLQDSHVALVDIDAESLDSMLRVAQGMNAEAGTCLTFEATTDLRAALDGSRFVIISVAQDRATTWKTDWEIPHKHGVKHILGENGGPGGLGHTLRSVSLVLDIAQEIEEVAPEAWVLNFTNRPYCSIPSSPATRPQSRSWTICWLPTRPTCPDSASSESSWKISMGRSI